MTAMPPEAYTVLGLGRYLCPACPARFHTLGDKRRHLHANHPKATP